MYHTFTSSASAHGEAEPPAGDSDGLALLEAKANAMLPPQYQSFDSVSPTSMGSAGLKYGPDRRVAWDQIWTHFCDLALAGGPPHRGSLLEAPTADEVLAEPAGYQLVYEEIVRGVRLTTGLEAAPAPVPGWVAVRCDGEGMAAWLLRAVMAENVFARQSPGALLVPADPRFRLAKEIKNVIVALAKTYHYWSGHMSAAQRKAAAGAMSDPELLGPASRAEVLARADDYRAATEQMRRAVESELKFLAAPGQTAGWVGVVLPDQATAAWFVRAAIASDILARREDEVLCLPVPAPDRSDATFEAVDRVARLRRLWETLPRTDG